MFPNKYSCVCNNPTCNQFIPVGKGFIQGINDRWIPWCSNCVPKTIVNLDPDKNFLSTNGELKTQFNPATIDLIRSIPGARWNPEKKIWKISIKMSDRARVLEILDRIGVSVPSSFRNIPQTVEANLADLVGLYPFQVEGVNFISHKDRSLLGDDMGLGKTVQALMAIPLNGKALVICRAGLKYNWLDEVEKWRKDLSPIVINDKKDFRYPKENEVVIVNYHLLPEELIVPAKQKAEKMVDYWARLKKYRQELKDKFPVAKETFLILDEAHDFKNPKAGRTKKVKELVKLSTKSVGLTGSPLPNRPKDLWNVLSVLGLATETFRNFDRFTSLFQCVNVVVPSRKRIISTIQWGKPLPIVPELLRRVMLRRKREEVLPELPIKTYKTLLVDITDESLRNNLNKLWQTWGSILLKKELPPFEKFSSIRQKLAASRIEEMLEYVENAEEQNVPLVVFSAHLAPLDKLLGRPGWAVINGEASPEKRQEIVRAFQAGKLKGLGVSIKAGGVGLTLTHAWQALFVDLEWNPGDNWQAEDRLARIGQESNKVEIIRMVSNHPLDIHIQNLLAYKADTIHRAIDFKK